MNATCVRRYFASRQRGAVSATTAGRRTAQLNCSATTTRSRTAVMLGEAARQDDHACVTGRRTDVRAGARDRTDRTVGTGGVVSVATVPVPPLSAERNGATPPSAGFILPANRRVTARGHRMVFGALPVRWRSSAVRTGARRAPAGRGSRAKVTCTAGSCGASGHPGDVSARRGSRFAAHPAALVKLARTVRIAPFSPRSLRTDSLPPKSDSFRTTGDDSQVTWGCDASEYWGLSRV